MTPLGSEVIRRRAQGATGREDVNDGQGSFAGGLNTISADDALLPNQFRRGDNGRLTQFGAFTKRGGTQRTAALIAAASVLRGYTWFQTAGTSVLMAVVNGGLYTTAYGAFPLTWTNRAGALSTTVVPSLAQFVNAAGTDSVFIADGGLLNRYTGTTLTVNIASTPSVDALAVHNERLWGTGDTSQPDAIYYSALNNGDSLGIVGSSGGMIRIRTFGDQECIGLASVGPSLMIVHRSGISRFTGYGQSDVSAQPAGITADVGSIAKRSLCVWGNILYLVSDRGLYAATEQGVMPIGTPERPDPLSIILPDMTAADIANIECVLNRATRELLISVPGVGIYVYHTILKAWAGPWVDGFLDPATTCLFEAVNEDGYPIVMRGDASGYVSETDRPSVYLDNVAAAGTGGTSYAMALQCRRLYAGSPWLSKGWLYLNVLAQLRGSSAASVAWQTGSAAGATLLPLGSADSWGQTGTTWGGATTTWGALAQFPYRVDMGGYGYYVDVTISDSGQAAPIISQVMVQGFLLGRR